MHIRWYPRHAASCRLAAGVALGAAFLVQSCAKPPPPPAPTARVYAMDLQGGAKSCDVPKGLTPDAGKDTAVKMMVGNDGGWCAISLARGGKPYGAGLLTAQPSHGTVYIHTVGDTTRIDYTPAAHYTGPDSFGVRLVPGEATLNVSVTVS